MNISGGTFKLTSSRSGYGNVNPRLAGDVILNISGGTFSNYNSANVNVDSGTKSCVTTIIGGTFNPSSSSYKSASASVGVLYYRPSVISGTHAAPTATGGLYNLDSDTLPMSSKTHISTYNVKGFIGAKMDYTVTGGGTWRVYYLDTANKYQHGANVVYLIRDYDANLTINTMDSTVRNYTSGLTFLKRFNKLWGSVDGTINNENEKVSAYMCTFPNNDFCNPNLSQLAIASPSIELFMDSYNQWGGYASGRGPLSYGFDSGANGYKVGVNGSFTTTGSTANNSLSNGPSNIYYASGQDYWLSSPSMSQTYASFYILSNSAAINWTMGTENPIRPVVVLSQ